jgi:cAMP phosphodiesterase
MMYYKNVLLLLLCYPIILAAQINKRETFKIVPLGVKGGIDESNLSAYMLAPLNSNNYVCLDAGTIHYGIKKAIKAGIFKTSPAYVLKNNIKGYLISHAHLDHTAGLIINSPDDTAKNIYGLPFCINILKDKYFNWQAWANFANEGDKPALNKYHYSILSSDKETPLDNTDMFAKAFTLSHSKPYESTAFLIRKDSSYILYLGDTGADEIEKSDKLHQLWQQVAPLIVAKKLKGIFIEVSFPNEQPSKQLFGHLTPQLLINEMSNLSNLTGKNSTKGLNVIITHVKSTGKIEAEIKRQLAALNTLKLHLIFAQQAEVIKL